jgi:pyruvate/2-oxoacid:ferredoxin oxidoreductase beta subunit
LQPAVRTNYSPLWEAENGKFPLTHKGSSPRPIKEYSHLTGKYAHMTEEERARFQQVVNERYELIKILCEAGAIRKTK